MDNKRNRLTVIYSDYFPIVFNAIYAKIGNRDDTEDLCQEVFVRLFNKLDEVDNVRRWLFNALKLVVMEYFRNKKKQENVDIDEIFQDVSITFVNGFRDTRIIINDAIENSGAIQNEKERLIFDLIAINNFAYERAGRQLGMTRRQVTYQYKKIVGRILDYLKKRGISNIEELL